MLIAKDIKRPGTHHQIQIANGSVVNEVACRKSDAKVLKVPLVDMLPSMVPVGGSATGGDAL